MQSFDREQMIRQELLELVNQEMPPILSLYWWYTLLTHRIMSDNELRTQLLRFVDVFPSLGKAEDISRHVKEYLIDGLSSPPCLIRAANLLARFPFGKHIIALAAKTAVGAMAHRFMVSQKREAIHRAVENLLRCSAGYSFDILGEQVLSEAEAESYKEKYLDLIYLLFGAGYPVDISLKLSSLYSQFDPLAGEATAKEVKKRLIEIARPVRDRNGTLTIDIEHFYFRNLSWEIIKVLLSEDEFFVYPGFGVAHQAYLKDSEEFLNGIIHFAKERSVPLGIRLVKGAYWDYEFIRARQKNWQIPVYTERAQTDVSFERNVDIALAAYPLIRTAIGSHNASSLAYAMAKREALGLPHDALEFQVLYGLGSPLIRPIRKMGYPVRVYVGAGDMVDGMGYLARRLLENTSQASSAFFAINKKKGGEGVDGHAF